MCLYINYALTKKHSRLRKNREYVFYKDFKLSFESDLSYQLVTYFQLEPIKMNAKIIRPKEFYIEIDDSFSYKIHGGVLHLYTKKEESEATAHKEICIPVIVESDDIIAFGDHNDVCVSKYKIPKESWEEIHNRINFLEETITEFMPLETCT